MPRKDLIQYRRDTASNWTNVNPVLAAGEVGFDSTNAQLRVGDGSTAWVDLRSIGATSPEAIEAIITAYLADHPQQTGYGY